MFSTAMRKSIVALMLCLLMAGVATAQDTGVVTKPSAHSVVETLDRLEEAFKAKGFMIFTRLDHAEAAEKVGLKMPPSRLLVFGSPKLGTLSFLKWPTVALDMPLKALVWNDAQGKTWVTYNSAQYVADTLYPRHGATFPEEAKSGLDRALREAVETATK